MALEMERRISSIEDMREEVDISVKENVKTEKLPTQSMQANWETMKRPNYEWWVLWQEEKLSLKAKNHFQQNYRKKIFLA